MSPIRIGSGSSRDTTVPPSSRSKGDLGVPPSSRARPRHPEPVVSFAEVRAAGRGPVDLHADKNSTSDTTVPPSSGPPSRQPEPALTFAASPAAAGARPPKGVPEPLEEATSPRTERVPQFVRVRPPRGECSAGSTTRAVADVAARRPVLDPSDVRLGKERRADVHPEGVRDESASGHPYRAGPAVGPVGPYVVRMHWDEKAAAGFAVFSLLLVVAGVLAFTLWH